MKFMLASMITQIISLGAFYPFDVIKVRMQTSNHIYKYKNGILYELEMSKGASVFMKLVK